MCRRHKVIQGNEPLRARVEAELRDQGLSVAITDPTVVTRIAALLGAEDTHEREKRLAAIERRLADMELRWRPGVDDPAW
jgi:hypothetical protein